MIHTLELTVEKHPGRRPRIRLRRSPRPGDRVTDGGIPGTLVRCPECGDGLLHQPDPTPAPQVLPDE